MKTMGEAAIHRAYIAFLKKRKMVVDQGAYPPLKVEELKISQRVLVL